MPRAALFALTGVLFFAYWVVADPSYEGPISSHRSDVLRFSAVLLILAVALPVFGRMVGGRWVFRLSLLSGAGVALASLANVAEDGLQMSWAFFVFVAGTAVLLLALLPLTVVIAFTRRGAARLLALIPAGTMAGVVFLCDRGWRHHARRLGIRSGSSTDDYG